MSAPLCHCDPPQRTTCLLAGKRSKHAGREFWSCVSCNYFKWVDQGGTILTAPGPTCHCGLPSRHQISKSALNPGRPYWTCSSTSNSRCGFFQWESNQWEHPSAEMVSTSQENQSCKKCRKTVTVKIVAENNHRGNAGRKYYKCDACGTFDFITAAQPQAPPTASTPGSAEYVVDEITRRHLQRLFHIPFGTVTGVGRDQREDSAPYDFLKVECAWRVSNPQREKRFMDFREKLAEISKDMRVESKLVEAQDLLGMPLDEARNEMLLLHGTKPEHLHSILFEGLDPHLSKDGLFGKGTYLSEDAAKIDQYVTRDHEWKGGETDHELYPLHKKLYDRGVKHANDVYYALVCRLALGDVAVTKDGTTCAKSGKPIFEDGCRDSLKEGKTSLLAELGEKIQRFREFVVFDPAALSIEFLVALKRVRQYCDCGQAAVHKTVTNGRPENLGREILFCPRSGGDDDAGCGFIHMLPRCHCGRAAEVAAKRNGDKYFRCGSKRNFCDFKDWNGPGQSKRRRS